MTDNEIIEALDFCEGYNGVSFCSRCPLFNERLEKYHRYTFMFGKVVPVSTIDSLVKEMTERTKSEDAGKRIYDDFMKSCKL